MAVLNEPTIILEGVNIRALHLKSIDMDITLRIENPNPFGATVRELPFTVFFRDGDQEKEIASGETVTVNIPASNGITITVPVTSHDLALAEGLTTLIKKGYIRLEIRGTAVIDHIVGWSLPFTKTVDLTEHEIGKAVMAKITGKQGS
jgi:LEA14-like dessication related protein